MKRLLVAASLALAFGAIPAPAFAAAPAHPSCWGAAASDLAQTGGMGAHASSFDSPRLGIGNVADLFTGSHQPGDLAAALGFVCA